MPLVRIETTATPTDEVKLEISKGLSRIVAEVIGKSEAYVMTSITHAEMTMGGQPGPTAFLDVRSIGGLNQKVNRALTTRVCALLEEQLSIPPDRVYISFASAAGVDWGWNNSTFG